MTDIDRFIGALVVLCVYAVLCWFYLLRRHRAAAQKISTHTQYEQSAESLDLLIAYASQSGTAALLANQSATLLEGQRTCQILPLDQVDRAVLARSSEVLFVVSTYGEGEAPDNAYLFVKRFLADPIELELSHLRFTVIALGDRVYKQFCAFGHQLYQGLLKLGAIPVLEPIEVCASQANDPVKALTLWRNSLGINTPDPTSLKHSPDDLKLLATIPPELASWRLIKRQHLNPGSPGAAVYLISLAPQSSDTAYWSAGDLIEVTLSKTELKELGQELAEHAVIRRKYSIASIPEQGVLELVVRQHIKQDGSLGYGSGWLTQLAAINAPLKLQLIENAAFHGVDVTRPLILIGSGTGIAGLRAHIKMRVKQGAKPTWLVFGERSQRYDSLFADEIVDWQQQGALQRVDLCFSRDGYQPRYVQDILLKQAQQVRQWVSDGAAILVCGSRLGMAQGVDQCLQQILSAQDYQQLLTTGIYRRDVY